MVSKRQKLAKKKFKETHPELFPEPEPTPPKDPNKKKKKKPTKFKRKKADSKDLNDLSNKNKRFTKRPIRVAGMKPGDTCFICKGIDHIAKLCPQKAEWEKHKICLFCRQRGHSLKRCPDKNDDAVDKKFCYNCGETGHTLSKCPQPLQDGGTRFAPCFVCNERGHLSKDCPKNPHGIYPKGGCCKICGGVTHLAKDCPNKNKEGFPAGSGTVSGVGGGVHPTGKVTKFVSGDDLDDDFGTDYTRGVKDKSTGPKASSGDSKDAPVKSQKKHGPKVVNFVG